MQRFFIPMQTEKMKYSQFYFQVCLTVDTALGWEANGALIAFYLFKNPYLSGQILFFNKASNHKGFSFDVF